MTSLTVLCEDPAADLLLRDPPSLGQDSDQHQGLRSCQEWTGIADAQNMVCCMATLPWCHCGASNVGLTSGHALMMSSVRNCRPTGTNTSHSHAPSNQAIKQLVLHSIEKHMCSDRSCRRSWSVVALSTLWTVVQLFLCFSRTVSYSWLPAGNMFITPVWESWRIRKPPQPQLLDTTARSKTWLSRYLQTQQISADSADIW